MSSVQPITHLPSSPLERRNKPRIQVAFPALVRGNDAGGSRFQEDALVDNMSASGVYLRLKRAVAPGSLLFVTLRFSNRPPQQTVAPCLAIRAQVLRVEYCQDGTCGLALKFQNYRFLDCTKCNCEFKQYQLVAPKEV